MSVGLGIRIEILLPDNDKKSVLEHVPTMRHPQVFSSLEIRDLHRPLSALGSGFVNALADLPQIELNRLGCDIYLGEDKCGGNGPEYKGRRKYFPFARQAVFLLTWWAGRIPANIRINRKSSI
jgi:hypothetical protein